MWTTSQKYFLSSSLKKGLLNPNIEYLGIVSTLKTVNIL